MLSSWQQRCGLHNIDITLIRFDGRINCIRHFMSFLKNVDDDDDGWFCCMIHSSLVSTRNDSNSDRNLILGFIMELLNSQ